MQGRLLIEHLTSIDSTNSELLRRDPLLPAESGADAIWLVASEQTAGRGRRQRGWLSSPDASLTASFGRDVESASGFGSLSLVAGVAVADALQLHGVSALLKWPNDLYLARTDDERPAKAGGILCEARARGGLTRLVIGVGLNLVSPAGAERLDQPVCGLFDERAALDRAERDLLVRRVGQALLTATDRLLAEGFAALRDRWSSRDLLLRNRDVMVHRDGVARAARACGIDDDGALRVEYADRPGVPERLLSEEVSVRPAA